MRGLPPTSDDPRIELAKRTGHRRGWSAATFDLDGEGTVKRYFYSRYNYLDCHRFYYCFDLTEVMIEGRGDPTEGLPCRSWNTPRPRPSWPTPS
jgi:hypothetical protein